MVEIYVVAVFVICCFIASSFLLTRNSGASSAAAILLLLGLIAIRPGILGEWLGAIGVLALLPIWYLNIKNRDPSNGKSDSQSRTSLILFTLSISILYLWDGIQSDFESGIIFVWAIPVAVIAYIAGREFAHSIFRLKRLVVLGSVFVGWQTLAGAVSFLSISAFPIRPINQTFGRDWIYSYNQLGGIFVGKGVETSSVLNSILGLNFSLDQPRLTGFWGEPALFAAIAVLIASIDLHLTRKLRAGIQIPIFVAVLISQSFAGILCFVGVCIFRFIQDSLSFRSTSGGRLNRILALIPIFGLAALATSFATSKFSKNTSSLDDRVGGVGFDTTIINILSNPLGSPGSGSGINLLQMSLRNGWLTLIFGLVIFVVLPIWQMKGKPKSPIFLVATTMAFFVEPPLLPLWFLILGLHEGSLAGSTRTSDKLLEITPKI